MKGEIVKGRGQTPKVFVVEDFLPGTRTVPVTYLTCSPLRFQEMRQMRAKRRHTASPSYVDHLAQRGFDVKVSERSDATHDVAGTEIENVTGSGARGTILSRR